MADVHKLIQVLHRLVNGGHSVVVIEHDLDVIAETPTRIIDLGPEGGKDGGRIVAAATPEDVVRQGTHTGKALAPVLAPLTERGAFLQGAACVAHTPPPGALF